MEAAGIEPAHDSPRPNDLIRVLLERSLDGATPSQSQGAKRRAWGRGRGIVLKAQAVDGVCPDCRGRFGKYHRVGCSY